MQYFKQLHTLHLVNTIASFEVTLLELLGTIDSLVNFTFTVTENGVQYRSRDIINVEEGKVRHAKEG